VSSCRLQAAERLCEHLFTQPDPDDVPDGQNWRSVLNPASEEVLAECWVEPNLAGAEPESFCQFERLGYFVVDPESTADRLVFNRSVTLKDAWAKVAAAQG